MTNSRTLLAIIALLAFTAGAAAETKLTDFNGEWRGSGQDRDTPLQSLQPTTCQNAVRATPQRMLIDMTCEQKSAAGSTGGPFKPGGKTR
jgi:hypothetical protein